MTSPIHVPGTWERGYVTSPIHVQWMTAIGLHTCRQTWFIDCSCYPCNFFLYIHRKRSTFDSDKEEKKSQPGITSIIKLVSGCMQISNPVAHFILKHKHVRSCCFPSFLFIPLSLPHAGSILNIFFAYICTHPCMVYKFTLGTYPCIIQFM